MVLFLDTAGLIGVWDRSDQWHRPSRAELSAAWRSYRSGRIGGPGVVDLVSMQVMKRERITKVLTNDRHFAEAGFEPLY